LAVTTSQSALSGLNFSQGSSHKNPLPRGVIEEIGRAEGIQGRR